MNCIDTNQTKLLNSLSAYVPDLNNLSVPIHERDIVHLFDVHHQEDDINAIENSEAYYTHQYALMPGLDNTLELCVLIDNNYFGCEYFSDPLMSFSTEKPLTELTTEILHTIESIH